MARSRFRPDRGLSVRMGLTMVLLALLYVVLILAIGYFTDALWLGILIGLGVAVGAVVLLGQAGAVGDARPRGVAGRGSAAARDRRPAVRPGQHAQAAGRDRRHRAAQRLRGRPKPGPGGASCATTGLMRRLDERELEAVLSHELSHVAHRDVTVMTIASVVGVLAGFMTRALVFGGIGRQRDGNAAAVALAATAIAVVVYAVSFLLTRLLSRYRELAADRAGAILTGQPSVLAQRADQDLRGHGPHSGQGSAGGRAVQRVLRRAGPDRQDGSRRAVRVAPAAGEATRPAGQDLRRARPGLRVGLFDSLLGRSKQAQPNLDALFSLPGAALTLEAAADIRPTGTGAVCFREAEGAPFARVKAEITALLGGAEPAGGPRQLRLYLAGGPPNADDIPALVTDLHAVNSTSRVGRIRASSCCARRSGCARPRSSRSHWCTSTSGGRSTRSRRSTPPRQRRDSALGVAGPRSGVPRPADRARCHPMVPGLGRPGPLTRSSP